MKGSFVLCSIYSLSLRHHDGLGYLSCTMRAEEYRPFADEVKPLKASPKNDRYGLGYDPYEGAEEMRALKKQRTEQANWKRSRLAGKSRRVIETLPFQRQLVKYALQHFVLPSSSDCLGTRPSGWELSRKAMQRNSLKALKISATKSLSPRTKTEEEERELTRHAWRGRTERR